MSVLDILSIAVTISMCSLIIVNGALIIQGAIVNGIMGSGYVTNTMPTYNLLKNDANTIYAFDVGIVLLYFGLWISAIIAAAYLESETINLPIAIFMGIIIIMVSFVISNAMHAILSNPAYKDVVPHFPNMLLLLSYLPIYTAIFIIIYAIVILARPMYTGGSVSYNARF